MLKKEENWYDANDDKQFEKSTSKIQKSSSFSRKREPYSRNPENHRQSEGNRQFWRHRNANKYGSQPHEQVEFRRFEKEFHMDERKYNKIKEITMDLFAMNKEYSLAHCVAEDMNMGSGIAVQFRLQFKRVDELLNQYQTKGGLAILQDDSRYIYYLVTKTYSTDKPTYFSLFCSLFKMKQHISEHGVKKLAIPRIGCGLDRLEWDKVHFMLEFLFHGVDVEIVTCNLEMNAGDTTPRSRCCKVTSVTYPIQEIEESTIILYFSSEDSYISNEMKLLDKKSNFLVDFQRENKRLGDVIKKIDKHHGYLLCGCITKKSGQSKFDFSSLKVCVQKILKLNKEYKFEYVGYQAIRDRDPEINSKIINLLKNNLRNVEIYVCYPGDLSDLMIRKDRPNVSHNQSYGEFKRSTEEYSNTSTSKNQFNFNTKNAYNKATYCNPKENENINEGLVSSTFYSDSDKKSITDFDANREKKISGELKPRDSFKRKNVYTKSKINQQHFQRNDYNDVSPLTQPVSSSEQNQTASSSQSESILLDSPTPMFESSVDLQKTANSMPTDQESGSCYDDDFQEEFKQYQKEKSCQINFRSVSESNVPLKRSSIAYCVSEDMQVCKEYQKFIDYGNHLGELLNQQAKAGEVAYVKDASNFTIAVIVMETATQEPKEYIMFSALQKMRNFAQRNAINNIIFPHIVSSSKNITLYELKVMLEVLFRRTRVKIVFSPLEANFKKRRETIVVHSKSPLYHIKPKSLILYLCSTNNVQSNEMKHLDKKFKFLDDFQNCQKQEGTVISYVVNDEPFVLCGCVVLKPKGIDFIALEKCMIEINQENKEKWKFQSVGIQAFVNEDSNIMSKVITILLNNLENLKVQVCWPGELKKYMPSTSS